MAAWRCAQPSGQSGRQAGAWWIGRTMVISIVHEVYYLNPLGHNIVGLLPHDLAEHLRVPLKIARGQPRKRLPEAYYDHSFPICGLAYRVFV